MLNHQLLLGNCLDVLRDFPDNSIDAVVTDPPYGLSFMGKKWDYDLPDTATWAECLRVLKPGGNLLSFAGTRTQHRMVANILGAGFELQDIVLWSYGCLSEDSEVLTKDGWVQYHKAMDSEVLSYDVERDIYKWERPQRWYVYGVESDTAFRIRSDETDQIVSRGHRCLVERDGKLVFVGAEKLSGVEVMPTLQSDFFDVPESKEGELQQGVQWELQGSGLGQARSQGEVRMDGEKLGVLSRKNDWAWKPRMEGGTNLLQKEREVCGSVNKVRAVPRGLHGDGTERWLCDGAQTDSGSGSWETSLEGGVRPPYQSRCDRQQVGELNAIRFQCGSQEVRTRASYRTTLATITPIKYSGVFWCPTVSTGAFVARRNGKVFVTGNSGFPKSLDVSKAIDKAAGVKFDAVPASGVGFMNAEGAGGYNVTKNQLVRKGESTPYAQQWAGWGTALKPAYEPVSIFTKGSSLTLYAEPKRLYYCAKAPKKDRNLGLPSDATNTHPTIKPLKLMEQLCQLATPPGGTILDPFMGSGTTGIAALNMGYSFVGIDMGEEYFDIASRRLNSLFPKSEA